MHIFHIFLNFIFFLVIFQGKKSLSLKIIEFLESLETPHMLIEFLGES